MQPTVLIIHPAWHTCGSATVFERQVSAYQTAGFRVFSFAIGMSASAHSNNRSFWREYYERTYDMMCDKRWHTGLPLVRGRLSFLFNRKHEMQTYAGQVCAPAAYGKLPQKLVDELKSSDQLHFHVNHYFCMPAAERLVEATGRNPKILLETHDIQSRQYSLRGEKNRYTGGVDSYEDMLAEELKWLAKADTLVHLNNEELDYFSERLPSHQHELLYPTVAAGGWKPANPEQKNILLVSSNNHPNLLSLEWFLSEVAPLLSHKPDYRIQVVGNIENAIRHSNPELYGEYKSFFFGLVPDISNVYKSADVVILPTISGHGISIKTIECLAYGKNFVATPLAFRGLPMDDLAQIYKRPLPDDAESFAEEICQLADGNVQNAKEAGLIYDRFFSEETYQAKLMSMVDAAPGN